MAKIRSSGTLLQLKIDDVFTTVAQISNFTGPSLEVGTTEVTDILSTRREYAYTLSDPGDVTGEGWFDPQDSTQLELLDLYHSPGEVDWQIVWTDTTPGPTTWAFSGILNSFQPGGIDPGEYTTFSFGIKVNSDIEVSVPPSSP